MSKRKALVKKLDTLFSKLIRKREPYCVICGSRENLTAGHLFSRVNYATRWCMVNTHTQCMGCNLRHEHDWEPYRRWFVDTYGQEEYDELYRQHNEITHFKDHDLEEMYIKYKSILEEME